MQDFYVRCGDKRRVIYAPNSIEAMQTVVGDLLSGWKQQLELHSEISVSKTGFDATETTEVDLLSLIFCTPLVEQYGLDQLLAATTLLTDSETNGDCQPAREHFQIYPFERFEVIEGDDQSMMQSWAVMGCGLTIHVWQVDGQPLCVDLYQGSLRQLDEILETRPAVELEFSSSTDESPSEIFGVLQQL